MEVISQLISNSETRLGALQLLQYLDVDKQTRVNDMLKHNIIKDLVYLVELKNTHLASVLTLLNNYCSNDVLLGALYESSFLSQCIHVIHHTETMELIVRLSLYATDKKLDISKTKTLILPLIHCLYEYKPKIHTILTSLKYLSQQGSTDIFTDDPRFLPYIIQISKHSDQRELCLCILFNIFALIQSGKVSMSPGVVHSLNELQSNSSGYSPLEKILLNQVLSFLKSDSTSYHSTEIPPNTQVTVSESTEMNLPAILNHFEMYLRKRKTFSGKDCIDWLLQSEISSSREGALLTAQELIAKGYIQSLNIKDNKMYDSPNFLYRYTRHTSEKESFSDSDWDRSWTGSDEISTLLSQYPEKLRRDSTSLPTVTISSEKISPSYLDLWKNPAILEEASNSENSESEPPPPLDTKANWKNLEEAIRSLNQLYTPPPTLQPKSSKINLT